MKSIASTFRLTHNQFIRAILTSIYIVLVYSHHDTFIVHWWDYVLVIVVPIVFLVFVRDDETADMTLYRK